MKAALYARISTNEQRNESIDDQLRECRELCRRHDFRVIDEFSDRGRSGNEVNRSGYQALLRAARHREYDVIVAHELSRLWRSESEIYAIKEELEYLNVLKGLALDGRSAGGKCYGYISATKSTSGKREIDEPQTREVRRIFAWYAAGKSTCWIAERLNEEGVLSPGSDWRRTARRRDGKWLASAIYGDPKRGSGILNNELYIGRYIWNRRRSRKKLESGDREFLMRPSEEWIATSHPDLRIVSDDVSQNVKTRQRERQPISAPEFAMDYRSFTRMRRAHTRSTRFPGYFSAASVGATSWFQVPRRGKCALVASTVACMPVPTDCACRESAWNICF